MRSLKISLLVGSTVLLFGQVLDLQAKDLRTTAAAKAACGAEETTFAVKVVRTPAAPLPDSDKALVYIIENGGFTLKLGLDGQWIGAVSGNSYTVTTMNAGEHHLCAEWQSHEKQIAEKVALHGFTAVAGHTYYFMTHDIAQGSGGYIVSLEPADLDEAKMLIEGLSQVSATAKK